jgi:hypothetical protein
MSKMIEINLRPDEETLRQFGFIALVGFGFVAALAWFEWLVFAGGLGAARPLVAGGLAGLSLLSGLLSLVHPRANLPIYVGLTLLSYPIGFVLSYVIMGTLFFGVITPVGLIFRLMRRDALHRRMEPQAASYWLDPRPRRSRESYFKQF